MAGLLMANVEALAGGEGSLPQIPCYDAPDTCYAHVMGSNGRVIYRIEFDGMRHSVMRQGTGNLETILLR
jgi:hypothetical protein